MASITTGSIVNEIRGSVGTEAYSRNAFGAYVKARTTPANPNTVPQQNARQVIADGVVAWRSLTDDQRELYVVEARSRTSQNRLGLPARMTGYNLFIRQFQLANRTASPDPTSVIGRQLNGIYRMLSLDLTASAFLVTFTSVNLVALSQFCVYASDGRSSGRISFNPSTLRSLSCSVPPTGNQVLDISAGYIALFGALVTKVGQRVTVGSNTHLLSSAELSATSYLSQLVSP